MGACAGRRGDGATAPPRSAAPPTVSGAARPSAVEPAFVTAAVLCRRPDPAPAALARGDTTTLGLLVTLTERAEQDGTRFLAVAEVEDDCVAATRELLPDAVVLTAEERADAAAAHLLVTEAAELLPDLAPRLVLLAGHGESVQRQRTLLREHDGLDRRLVRTQPYGATGRTGL